VSGGPVPLGPARLAAWSGADNTLVGPGCKLGAVPSGLGTDLGTGKAFLGTGGAGGTNPSSACGSLWTRRAAGHPVRPAASTVHPQCTGPITLTMKSLSLKNNRGR